MLVTICGICTRVVLPASGHPEASQEVAEPLVIGLGLTVTRYTLVAVRIIVSATVTVEFCAVLSKPDTKAGTMALRRNEYLMSHEVEDRGLVECTVDVK